MSQRPGGVYFVQAVHKCSMCQVLSEEMRSLRIEQIVTLAPILLNIWTFYADSLFSCPNTQTPKDGKEEKTLRMFDIVTSVQVRTLAMVYILWVQIKNIFFFLCQKL